LRPNLQECFRLNLWPNALEILPAYLQIAGHAAFVVRLIIAATLGASYWIYTPAFAELRAAAFLRSDVAVIVCGCFPPGCLDLDVAR
jgi:hypothetical protein